MKAQPTVLEEQAAEMNPNLDVITGLCELVEFLSAHPELPPVYWGALSFEARRESPRSTMMLIADALGDRATEQQRGDDVTITGEFSGGLKVRISSQVHLLRGEPQAPPQYKPIIEPRADIPVGAGDFDA